jgi:formate-dependent phosphoribosylglycinamide formyltransferase (GAR transformylase)
VDAIECCKKLGVEVHACSFTEVGVGRGLVDYFSATDIVNIDGVCQYIVDHRIDWVYSVGSDLAMPTVSAVSEKLNLPHFISYQVASLCQNKIQLRSFLWKDIQGNIACTVVKSREDIESWEEYPCILKPVDSQGQRGVYLLESEREFNRYYEQSMKFSRKKELIIEKYIDGPEVSVNVYMKDQQIVFFQTSDRISFREYPGGIIKEHILPSKVINQAVEGKVLDLVTRFTEKLGISNGPVYFQIKISNGEPWLIEATPRLDGCHLWRLIRYSRGMDLMDVTFKHLIAQHCAFETHRVDGTKQYSLKFMCERPGEQVNRGKYDTMNALFIEWFYQQGERVRPMNGYMEKIGYRIVPEKE